MGLNILHHAAVGYILLLVWGFGCIVSSRCVGWYFRLCVVDLDLSAVPHHKAPPDRYRPPAVVLLELLITFVRARYDAILAVVGDFVFSPTHHEDVLEVSALCLYPGMREDVICHN